MAKNYIDNLSEETRKGMNEKAEQGIWPSFAPLGYLNITGDDGKKIIIPDKDHAQFIVQLYEWYGSGKYSIKELAKMAKESGMVFRKSKNPVNKLKLIHVTLKQPLPITIIYCRFLLASVP